MHRPPIRAGLNHERRAAMNLPKNILVPVDFSPFSGHALDYAVALATKLGAKVHLVNVVGFPPVGVPELGVALAASIIEDTVRANQVELAKLADARRGSGTIGEVMVRTGDARD